MVTQDRECVISATFPAFLAILVPVRAILSDASIPLVLPTGGCLAFGSPEGSHSGKAHFFTSYEYSTCNSWWYPYVDPDKRY